MTFTIFVGRPCDSPFIIRKVYTPSIFVSIFVKNCSEKRWSLLTGTNPSFPGNTYPVRQWVIKAREKCKFGVTVCLKRQAKINVRILFYCIVFTFLFLNNEALLKKRFQNHDDFSLWSNKRKLQFHPQICKEITLFSTFSSFSRLMAALRAGDSFDIAQIVVGGKKELKSREFVGSQHLSLLQKETFTNIFFQILWKCSRCNILVSFPSHLKKLCSILRFWLWMVELWIFSLLSLEKKNHKTTFLVNISV